MNLAPAFISDFAARTGLTWLGEGRGDLRQTFGPEDIFAYVYAILHSPAYRQRYAPFLKLDFPRIPLTSNTSLLRALCHLGTRLVSLHLLEQNIPSFARFPVSGSNIVAAVRYVGPGTENGRIWINATQYFAGIPPEAWTFSIGGYQVCQKWLKDRRGRQLSDDEVTHYQRIVAALAETTSLMREIDKAIEEYGGWPL